MSRWADAARAEWRGYREPRDTDGRLSRLGAALHALLPSLGLGDALDETEVRKAWSGIVGPFIAGQSAPDRLRRGVLHVRVHQSSVRFELERTWKAEITRKLAARFGPDRVREVKFI
jgi:predicted nucleic acid-binding Zn ribbon protein